MVVGPSRRGAAAQLPGCNPGEWKSARSAPGRESLFELLRSQGLQADQQVTFFTDGADDFHRWYAGFTHQADDLHDVAA
ncbi:MAG: hypothetical protein ACRDV9_11815 [Acidimicrobiia bacterium]